MKFVKGPVRRAFLFCAGYFHRTKSMAGTARDMVDRNMLLGSRP
jgi:hypothetical protein